MSTNCSGEIILLTASRCGAELQRVLEDTHGVSVHLATTFEEVTSAILLTQYHAIVIDEGLADLDPTNANRLFVRLKYELPIFIKLAISGLPRCVQQVQLALRRFELEQQSALYSIRAQVHDSLTSVLANSELAVKVQGLPSSAIQYIQTAIEAAEKIKANISDRSFG